MIEVPYHVACAELTYVLHKALLHQLIPAPLHLIAMLVNLHLTGSQLQCSKGKRHILQREVRDIYRSISASSKL